VSVKKGRISTEIGGFSIAIQRIIVVSHISDREVKERVELYNLCTDHVMIRSELTYLIGVKVVMLKCQVFGGKTSTFPVGRVVHGVRPIATVRFRVEPEPEPTQEFGPGANTRYYFLNHICCYCDSFNSLFHCYIFLHTQTISGNIYSVTCNLS
jgi:hypothetical protein